jgi:hypothetical protein
MFEDLSAEVQRCSVLAVVPKWVGHDFSEYRGTGDYAKHWAVFKTQ